MRSRGLSIKLYQTHSCLISFVWARDGGRKPNVSLRGMSYQRAAPRGQLGGHSMMGQGGTTLTGSCVAILLQFLGGDVTSRSTFLKCMKVYSLRRHRC